MKPPIKPGDIHFVVSHAYRTMKAFNSDGNLLWKIPALTEGVADNMDLPGGDTPSGLYKCGLIRQTSSNEDTSIWNAYGKFFTDLVELENQEASRGRAGVGTHGGGTGLEDPLAKHQPLIATRGCVRLHNEDNERMFVPLVRKTQQGGRTAYLTVTL